MLVSNKSQENAIKSEDKFTLIDAGPGAGKTRVLIERIKYLLNEKKVKPNTLLIITFTNKATDELKIRLLEDPEIDNDTLSHMHISTIHSFCKVLIDEYSETNYNLLASDSEFNEPMNMFIRKHRKTLGFVNEAHITGSELSKVLDLYDEFTIFSIDEKLEDLKEYIKENFPVSTEYKDFISSLPVNGEGIVYSFPHDKVKKDFKEDWYNAKLYRIVSSYPKFINLLKRGNYLDYNHLQIKACEILENPNIDFKFKNILVDEYQDIDPIQDKLFDTIINNFNLNSFTVVGDADQSIYGFRGSNPSYFTDFSKKYNCTPKILNTNYRSKNEIVNFTEKYIKKYRSNDYSKDLISYRGDGGMVSYITNHTDLLSNFNKKRVSIDELKQYHKTNNIQGNFSIRNLNRESKDLEFENISALIKNLKGTGKIKRYSDVGILLRKMNSLNGLSISRELEILSDNGIPFNLNTPDSLIDKNEIKIIVFLLIYIQNTYPPVFTKFEKDWCNLNFLASESFSEFYTFSDETRDILAKIETDYQDKILEIENNICKDFEGASKRKKFQKVFEESDELLKELFYQAKNITHDLSKLDKDDLLKLGFKNTNDINFILELNKIKEKFHSEEDNEDLESILELFYSLLSITDYFKKLSKEEKEDKIANISYFTNIIQNYMNIVDKKDLNGFVWYLNSFIDKYSSIDDETTDEGVNILTIHKSKGLEFPVVIIPSFQENKFPRKYSEIEIPNIKSGFATTYNIIPNQFFKYKNHDSSLDEYLYNIEEERAIYVAMTRARDLLVLSSIPSKNDDNILMDSSFITNLKSIDTNITELASNNFNNLPICESKDLISVDEVIDLSFSKYDNYLFCPYRFKLASIHNLILPTRDVLTYGTVIHAILENLGNISKEKGADSVDSNIINNEIINVFEDYEIDESNPDAEDVIKNVNEYWNKFGSNFNIVGTEIPFNLTMKHYQLNGFIDLVIKNNNNTLKIIDYKNTQKQRVIHNKENYARQLYVYYNSIKKMPEYENYEITGLSILALKDNAEIEMPVDKNKIKHVNEELEQVAKKIINKEFPKNPKKIENCKYCDYKQICYKGIKN